MFPQGLKTRNSTAQGKALGKQSAHYSRGVTPK